MLKPVSNRKSVLTCNADCPADNQARQLALFLYETLPHIVNSKDSSFLPFLRGKVSDNANRSFLLEKSVHKSHFWDLYWATVLVDHETDLTRTRRQRFGSSWMFR